MMHLIALHDSEGVILAAAVDDGETPTPVPVAEDGLMVSRVELSPAQASMPLDELCTTMRVDPRSGRFAEGEGMAAASQDEEMR